MKKNVQKCSREQQPRYRWQSFPCSRKSFGRFVLSLTFTFLHNSPSCKSEKKCWFRRARVPSTFGFFQQRRKLISKFFLRVRRLTLRIEKTLGATFWFKALFSLKVVFCWCCTQWHIICCLAESEKLKDKREINAAKCCATQKTPIVNEFSNLEEKLFCPPLSRQKVTWDDWWQGIQEESSQSGKK